MFRHLPGPLLAPVLFVLFVLNTLFWAVPVYAAILIKIFTPRGRARDQVSRLTAWLAQTWAVTNSWLGDRLLGTQWDIRGAEQLDRRGQYLVTANHQTWNDIYVLMKTFGRSAPFFKFFIKQQLIWVPILGLAWWGLDYPFMKRYSKEDLERKPHLRGKDLETTRKACEKFRNQPILLLNFLEGTRFTRAKHDRQNSPYRHLLRPRAGGLAFALAAMGDKFSAVFDVTIVYPDGAKGFWDLMAGRVQRVVVEVRRLTIPTALMNGDYDHDAYYRRSVQDWVASVWAEKDHRIDALLTEARTG
jgi:1-acyl-sn-glycerol-3-phosphate acyltransferase